jgi:DNA-binding Xre family transcriptional regulator
MEESRPGRYKFVGALLKKIRGKKPLHRMAPMLGMSWQQLSQIEMGRVKVPHHRVAHICAALGIPVGTMVDMMIKDVAADIKRKHGVEE